jgi:hypothetical protein
VTRSADASLTKRSAQSLKCVFGSGAAFDGVKKNFGTGFKIQPGAWFALVYYQDPNTTGVPSATFAFVRWWHN